MRPKHTICFAVLFTIALISAACAPKEGVAQKSEVLATVNGVPITQAEIDLILKQQRGMPDTPESRKMIIDGMAMQIVAAQEATKQGLDKTPEFKLEMEIAKDSVLTQALIKNYLDANKASDADIEAEYNQLKEKSGGKEYKARHILVKTEEQAKKIIEQLNKNPQEFAELAKKDSEDSGTKNKGGELGWFDPNSMVPEFSAALNTLQKGQMTEQPVKSEFGYHIIQLEDVREKKSNLPPLEQIKSALAQQIEQKKLREMLDKLKETAKIEIKEAPKAENQPEASENSSSQKSDVTVEVNPPAGQPQDEKKSEQVKPATSQESKAKN